MPGHRRWFIALAILSGLLGIAAGAFAGLPGLVERAGLSALNRLEERLGLRLDAAKVEWSYGGHVRAEEVVIRPRASDGDVLATIGTLEIDSEVDAWERRVRILRVALSTPVLKVTRAADGSSNLDPILTALARIGQGAGSAAPAGLTLEPELPIVVVDGLTLAFDAALPPLPLGLTLPTQATFEGGRLTVRPTGPSPDGRLTSTPLSLEGSFSSTSLDPGHGLGLSIAGTLGAPPTRLALEPARPVRFWLQDRVVGVGGIALGDRGVELGPLQLSVPIDRAGGTREVAAAASCDALVLVAPPRELAARLTGALSTLTGESTTRARLLAVLGAIDEVELVRPIVSLTLDAEGRHGYEDLLAAEASPSEGTTGDPAGAELASDPAVREPNKAKKANGDSALSDRIARPLAALERLVRQRVGSLSSLVSLASSLPLSRLTLRDGELILGLPGAQLTASAIGLEASTSSEVRKLALTVGRIETGEPAGAARPTLELAVKQAGDRLEVELGARDLPLSLVSERVLDGGPASTGEGASQAPLVAPRGTLTRLALAFDGDLAAKTWELSGHASLAGATLHHAAVAAAPLTDVALEVQGTLTWRADEERLSLSDGLVGSRGVQLAATFDIADALRRPKIHLALDLPETPVQRIVEALPTGFAPLLTGLRMDGVLAWQVGVDLDTTRPREIRIDSRPVARNLRVLTLGDALDLATLRGSHSYAIRLADGTPGQRLVGPMTGSWVPLSEITPYLPLALTTTEDGTFHSNDGISPNAMKESIATNLERGGFVRGGSTLTQQLVKNLFLGGDKTIARKLQEIFIAWQMAQQLSKDEVMALYLNTIEFGPGIYGIGDAAWHWFGKRPIDLDLTEAIFLASIIPGPRRYYQFFVQGAVTPRWRSYLERLLEVMVERGKITPQELAAAAPYEPLFRGAGGGYRDEPPADFDLIPEGDELDTP